MGRPVQGLDRPAAAVVLEADGGSAGDRRKRKADGGVIGIASGASMEGEWVALGGCLPGTTRPGGLQRLRPCSSQKKERARSTH